MIDCQNKNKILQRRKTDKSRKPAQSRLMYSFEDECERKGMNADGNHHEDR